MSNTISGSSVQPLIYEPRTTAQPDEGQQRGGFEAVLRGAIDQVQELQANSDQQVGSLLQGERGDVHNVMIAIEKADVAFQLMMQVRNKIVNAYQQVSQMQF
jgi:flagellar hook-basal body complex protein FliE